MKRLSDTPPSRFPARPIGEAGFRWWVAKLKPRQEKAFAADLITHDIEYYLPMYVKAVRRLDNNKLRKSVLPLFPGYISFAQDTPHNIFRGGRVVSVLEVRDQERFVRQLGQIYEALEAGAVLDPLVERFEPGERVRVRSGPLRGIEGVVSVVRGERSLVLEVEPFGRASLRIGPELLEPV